MARRHLNAFDNNGVRLFHRLVMNKCEARRAILTNALLSRVARIIFCTKEYTLDEVKKRWPEFTN